MITRFNSGIQIKRFAYKAGLQRTISIEMINVISKCLHSDQAKLRTMGFFLVFSILLPNIIFFFFFFFFTEIPKYKFMIMMLLSVLTDMMSVQEHILLLLTNNHGVHTTVPLSYPDSGRVRLGRPATIPARNISWAR